MDFEVLSSRIHQANWVAFDLDDTLHSFRTASSAATTSTLELIFTQHPDVNMHDLRIAYSTILKSSTAAAFTDGKTSHEYRAERFRRLLDSEVPEQEMKEILECYESTLMASLELKPHALSLLQTLKAQNKKIVVITEGPQDAQERTIAALGIVPYVDYLATTNKLGVSKVDGMFTRVLEVLGANAKEVVMVGDSWERDVVPAMNAGLICMWFDEKGIDEGKACDGAIRVGSLAEIESMVAASL